MLGFSLQQPLISPSSFSEGCKLKPRVLFQELPEVLDSKVFSPSIEKIKIKSNEPQEVMNLSIQTLPSSASAEIIGHFSRSLESCAQSSPQSSLCHALCSQAAISTPNTKKSTRKRSFTFSSLDSVSYFDKVPQDCTSIILECLDLKSLSQFRKTSRSTAKFTLEFLKSKTSQLTRMMTLSEDDIESYRLVHQAVIGIKPSLINTIRAVSQDIHSITFELDQVKSEYELNLIIDECLKKNALKEVSLICSDRTNLNTNIEKLALSAFISFHSLEKLQTDNLRAINSIQLDEIAKQSPDIQVIPLLNPKISLHELISLLKFKNLTKLDLRQIQSLEKDLFFSFLNHFKDLRSINVSMITKFDDQWLKDFCRFGVSFPLVTEINFSYTSITNDSLKYIIKLFPSLIRLNMKFISLRNVDDLKQITHLSSLEHMHLSFDERDFDKSSLQRIVSEFFSSFPKLNFVLFNGLTLDQNSKREIAKLKQSESAGFLFFCVD